MSVAFYVCTWITVTPASAYLTLYFTNDSPVTLPRWSYTDRHQMAGDVTWQVTSQRRTLSSTEGHQIAGDDTTKFSLTEAQMIYVTDDKLSFPR